MTMASRLVVILGCLGLCTVVSAIDNGLGRLPPMGWRSWNAYHNTITQDMMVSVAEAMVATTHGTSLKEAGYTHVGLDDSYQAMSMGVDKSFHNASGYPLINLTKFPSMNAMTDKIHSLGLQAGWYANNCDNAEHQKIPSWGTDFINHYNGDVQATVDFGFDGIKLDGCGEFLNLTLWADLLNKTGRPILIENCHWGKDGPGSNTTNNPSANPEDWCPFNFFRVSADIQNSWFSMFHNLQTLIPWQPWNGDASLVKTGPGCWAYGDMLEVGNLPLEVEDRTHFGIWAITSQPLILGFDVLNETTSKEVWPIVTNPHALAVSQSYHGHPGSMAKSWLVPLSPPPPADIGYLWCVHFNPADATQLQWVAPTAEQPGPLKNGNLCVEAPLVATGRVELELRPCTGAANQTFGVDVNGSVFLASNKSAGCLVVATAKDTTVVMDKCAGDSESTFYTYADGAICSRGSFLGQGRGYCLAAQDRSPQGQLRGIESVLSIWAKPQANGAVAVLAVNGDPSGANQTIAIDFATVKIAGKVTVFDVWAQQAVPGTFVNTFTTDLIEMHDSRFYLFQPATAQQE